MRGMRRSRSFWVITGPAITWALLIFIGSSIPSSAIPDFSIFRSDKLIHAGIYFVLAFFTHRALRLEQALPSLHNATLGVTIALCAFYGFTDEIHQHFVPGRSMDVYDWFADVLGILLYAAIWKAWQVRRAH